MVNKVETRVEQVEQGQESTLIKQGIRANPPIKESSID